MRRRLHGLASVAGVVLIASLAYDARVFAARGVAADRLRDARVTLQRQQTRRALLTQDSDRLLTLDLPRDALALSLVEALQASMSLRGVSELQYRLVDDSLADVPQWYQEGSLAPLRVVLRFRADHGEAFLQTLAAIGRTTGERPMHVSGCRLLREHRSLAASCALDWQWWPTS